MKPNQCKALNEQLASASPVAILKEACQQFERLGLAFSGAEDVVLIDMLNKIAQAPEIFCLDTGRLHPETYRFIEQVSQHYDVRIKMLTPDAEALTDLVYQKGLFSFYQDGHQECCGIRKVAPLKRYLSTLDGWITGQRQDQSPTRTKLAAVETDPTFSTKQHSIVKFNPLKGWLLNDVWDYIHDNEVPYNNLHDRGYISIGCEPCTRPPRPGEHERSGRWWWEESTQRECGLHTKQATPLIAKG